MEKMWSHSRGIYCSTVAKAHKNACFPFFPLFILLLYGLYIIVLSFTGASILTCRFRIYFNIVLEIPSFCFQVIVVAYIVHESFVCTVNVLNK